MSCLRRFWSRTCRGNDGRPQGSIHFKETNQGKGKLSPSREWEPPCARQTHRTHWTPLSHWTHRTLLKRCFSQKLLIALDSSVPLDSSDSSDSTDLLVKKRRAKPAARLSGSSWPRPSQLN